MGKRPTYEELEQRVRELEKESLKISQVEEGLEKKTRDLGERVKELNCLLSISELLEKRRISLEEILHGITHLIPPSFQHPELTCARIILEGQEFSTDNFSETSWKLTRDIVVHGERMGFVEVSLLEEKPEIDEGPFLKEERNLINAVAARLGKIIERNRAEEAIKHASAELNQILNSAADGMRLVDQGFNVLRMNETFLTLSGMKRDETHGKKCYEVLKNSLCHTPNCPLTRILCGEERVECEVEKERNNGTRISCLVTATPFRGPDGDLIGIVEDIKDISQIKQAERAIRESEKLAVVGRLAAGAAHSIRNPLTSVKMRLFSLARSLELSKTQKEDLDVISEEIRHIDSIVQNFLEFSRPPKLKMQKINPSDVVDSAIQLLRDRLKAYGTEVKVSRPRRMPEILGDKEQLKELLVNLLVNACEAMNGGGEIVISEQEESVESWGRVVAIRVNDNGPGVPEEVRERLFDPFFTTKEEGTGLGLSIAARIAKEHGGLLNLVSEEDKGATFAVILPYKGGINWERS
ncbi:MAG: hypothetical protein BBJ60_00700 [Desulfobacterales bacterium S7086C20]|nr:MAG: hypothetical protein BBJ60_00700 [Desulfobacterales bacterium S7086C20]